MKITNCNPARVATDFFYEPHGWLERLFMHAREAMYFHYNKRPCEQQITLLNQFWVIRNFPITLLPLSSLATNTCIGTLPWKLTIEPKAVHHQMPYLNVPDQSSNNTQLSHQNHLKVKSTGQNIWIANSHRPKWTTTINIDSRYKSNVATKQPPTTPKLQAPTNKIE